MNLSDATGPSTTGPCALVVSGEIDVLVADELAQACLTRLDTDAPGVTVDLAAVTYLDSSGIGALVAARNHALELGKTFRVVNPSVRVVKVLRITGLDTVFGAVEAPDVEGEPAS
jgi:anti-sigma B factor antagonist